MNRRKLVLTGFMGTGKTVLMQRIAQKMGLPAIDTDDLIVQRVGLTIPEIFAQHGEAVFRAWESVICTDVARDDAPAIISTGGGTLLNPANRQAIERNATVVCLTAQPGVVYERLKAEKDRPLLTVDDPLRQIHELLKLRQPVYSSFRYQIDTSDQNPDTLAKQIIALWEHDSALRLNEQLIQSPEGNYPLVIQRGTLDRLGDFLEVYGLHQRRTLIATDSNVAPLYGKALARRLLNAELVVMPAGEAYKHLDTINRFYSDFARLGLDRNGLVIALGGGVVGDTVGFAAATYMRGVRLVQIPTSLLAMVDSSVGGKVGVDIAMGKNLVGAFKQPDLVLIDPDVLRTLPNEEFKAGMGEVIKHGLLANPALLSDDMPLETRIREAVQVKIEVVQRDPYEAGERAHLNLGHTFGHAIEHVSGYTWRHGVAIAVGLVGAIRLSQRLGLVGAELVDAVEEWVQDADLPIRYQSLSPQAIWEAMHTDKKWRDGRSHFVVLRGIGKPDVVRDVPREMVMAVLEELRD